MEHADTNTSALTTQISLQNGVKAGAHPFVVFLPPPPTLLLHTHTLTLIIIQSNVPMGHHGKRVLERGNAAVSEHASVSRVCSALQQHLCQSHLDTTAQTHQRLISTHTRTFRGNDTRPARPRWQLSFSLLDLHVCWFFTGRPVEADNQGSLTGKRELK